MLPLDNEPVKVLEVVVNQGEVVVVCSAVHQWGVDGLQHRSKRPNVEGVASGRSKLRAELLNLMRM